MKPIFCGNFEYDARDGDLERLFRKYGKVERVDMKTGFAFVYMEDERDAEDAIQALDRFEFGRTGRKLRVEWTKNDRGGPRQSGSSRRSSSDTRPSKTLFVINFDANGTRTRDLEKHFEPYGKVVNVRIRRNFAFIQYETQETATRALDATNMSKLMDKVISVEYAVKDDDVRGNGYSPERRRDKSPDRRRRSLSPYRGERGSPNYGRGSSPGGAYRKERGSPDYGRGRGRSFDRSPSPYKRGRSSPDYGRRGKERGGRPENGRSLSKRELSPGNGRDARDHYGSYGRKGRGDSRSPIRRERSSREKGQVESPGSPHEPRNSRVYQSAVSPTCHRSGSPQVEE